MKVATTKQGTVVVIHSRVLAEMRQRETMMMALVATACDDVDPARRYAAAAVVLVGIPCEWCAPFVAFQVWTTTFLRKVLIGNDASFGQFVFVRVCACLCVLVRVCACLCVLVRACFKPTESISNGDFTVNEYKQDRRRNGMALAWYYGRPLSPESIAGFLERT
jgi:hypothetical protein